MKTKEYTPKPLKEHTDIELLELVCQLHYRALQYPSEKMHNNYIKARKEMESRLKEQKAKIKDVAIKFRLDAFPKSDYVYMGKKYDVWINIK